MVGLGKVIEMIGVQANAGTRSRIADLRLALRIVDEQLAVPVKIIAVTIAALPHVAFERGDPSSFHSDRVRTKSSNRELPSINSSVASAEPWYITLRGTTPPAM